MTKKERQKIIDRADTLTDEQLEQEYYRLAYETLGTQVDEMYELGYDLADIAEREEYEKSINEECSIFEALCLGRGIKLWE